MRRSLKPFVVPPPESFRRAFVVPMTPELPGMPEGDVPQDVRQLAEEVARLEDTLRSVREELETEKEKLRTKMIALRIGLIPVIVDRHRKRFRLEPGDPRLRIEHQGDVGEEKKEMARA